MRFLSLIAFTILSYVLLDKKWWISEVFPAARQGKNGKTKFPEFNFNKAWELLEELFLCCVRHHS